MVIETCWKSRRLPKAEYIYTKKTLNTCALRLKRDTLKVSAIKKIILINFPPCFLFHHKALCKFVSEHKPFAELDIFTMASFYNYQNPSFFGFLMLIRAIVLCCPLGLQNLNLKRKTKWIPSWKWPIKPYLRNDHLGGNYGINALRFKLRGMQRVVLYFADTKVRNSWHSHVNFYRSFSHDVTAAILVYQNNETAAILVYQTNPVGIKPVLLRSH